MTEKLWNPNVDGAITDMIAQEVEDAIEYYWTDPAHRPIILMDGDTLSITGPPRSTPQYPDYGDIYTSDHSLVEILAEYADPYGGRASGKGQADDLLDRARYLKGLAIHVSALAKRISKESTAARKRK